jgi:hypothetical protein
MLLIYSKILIIFHIVNVRPDCIKWNIIIRIVLNNFFKHVSRIITPSTLMPAKGPLRSEDRHTHNFVILFGNLIWILTKHEIKISNSSSRITCYIYNSQIIVIFDPPILSICQISKNSKPSIIFSPRHIKWVSSIHIISRRYPGFNRVWLIS